MAQDLPAGFELDQFKLTQDKAQLKYTIQTEKGPRTFRVKCEDPVHPDLRAALHALDVEIAALTETDHEDWRDSNPIRPTSVKWKRKDGETSVVLTGVRQLEEHMGTITLNTPRRILPAEPESEFERRLVAKLNDLTHESAEFLMGKRPQLTLAYGEEEGEQENELTEDVDEEVVAEGEAEAVNA